MPQQVRAALLVILMLLGGACAGPSISTFEVLPRTVCAGERVVVRWTANGEIALTMQLEVPPGSTPIAGPVPEIFKLRLVARKSGKEVVADQELVQLPPTSERALAISTKLQGDSVVASESNDTAVWNDRVEVWKVAAAGHRAIEVQHAGKTASLPADGAVSEALSGTPVGGLWDLQSPLSEAEQREPSIRPTNLEIRVTILCKPGKS